MDPKKPTHDPTHSETDPRPPPAKRSRRRRTEKPSRGAGCLTERDLEVLTFIGRSKVATTDVIARAYFSERTTASRRLSRLLGSGLIRVSVQELSQANHYSLSERGADKLVTEGVDEESLHVGRFPRREALEHLRYIAELRAEFLVAVRAQPEIALDLYLADHDLRRLAGSQVPPYVPDALVKLTTSEGAVGLLLEVDCGHETAKLIAETKGRATRLAAAAGAPLWGLAPWRAVFVAPSPARLRSAAQALVAEGAGDCWWGTVMDRLSEVGVLGAAYGSIARIAATPRGEPLPLTESVLPSPTRTS